MNRLKELETICISFDTLLNGECCEIFIGQGLKSIIFHMYSLLAYKIVAEPLKLIFLLFCPNMSSHTQLLVIE